jgi:hypothetical protein
MVLTSINFKRNIFYNMIITIYILLINSNIFFLTREGKGLKKERKREGRRKKVEGVIAW